MYNKLPVVVGNYNLINNKENLYYQYMPIKMKNSFEIRIESRLDSFKPLINAAIKYYEYRFGIVQPKSIQPSLYQSFIYITVKRRFQDKNNYINRCGWHSDSFMTNDINFIWSDCQPTIFNNTNFKLSQDDSLSLLEMQEQVDESKNVTYKNNSLLMLDQYSIHRVGEIESGVRTFAKISFSDKEFNLEGNTHNYLFEYKWNMKPRNTVRNQPY